MFPGLIEAKYLSDYKVFLRFDDETSGEVDLKAELYGELFLPLKNPDNFKNFAIDPEFKTLVWPNGADIAPEYLHDLLKKRLSRSTRGEV